MLKNFFSAGIALILFASLNGSRALSSPMDRRSNPIDTFAIHLGVSKNIEARSIHYHSVWLSSLLDSARMFPRFQCTIAFDTTCGTFLGVDTAHRMLAGAELQWTPIQGGVFIRSFREIPIDGSARGFPNLFALKFRVSDPDTAAVGIIQCKDWSFESPSAAAVLTEGQIFVVPYTLHFYYCYEYRKQYIGWDELHPREFNIEPNVRNYRVDTARNVVFHVLYDTLDMELISPSTPWQMSNPPNIPPGSSGSVKWTFRPKKQLFPRERQVCDSVVSDNFETQRCCETVWLDASRTSIALTAAIETIYPDSANRKYVPMPFRVSATIKNTGSEYLNASTASLSLPPPLAIVGAADPRTDTLNAASQRIAPGDTAVLAWSVLAPGEGSRRAYPFIVQASAINADDFVLDTSVVLPALPAPVIDPIYAHPDTLAYDPGSKSIMPASFSCTLRVRNAGSVPVVKPSAAIFLPHDFALDSLVSTKAQPFADSLLQPGDTTSTLTWLVRYVGRERYASDRRLSFGISWSRTAGGGTDGTIVDGGRIRIGGFPPLLECILRTPDSVFLRPDSTGAGRTALPVKFVLKNIADRPVRVGTTTLIFNPNDAFGLPTEWLADHVFTDLGTPGERKLDTLLLRADSMVIAWNMSIDYRTSLKSLELYVLTTDDEGDTLQSKTIVKIGKEISRPFLHLFRVYDGMLSFAAVCNGVCDYTFDKRSVTLTVDGDKVRDFELYCPDPSGPFIPSISVSLLFDPSGRSGARGLDESRAAANILLKMFIPWMHEVELRTTSPADSVIQPFTDDLTGVRRSLNSIGVSPGSGLWDGIWAGMIDLKEHASHARHAMVVFTDGWDYTSTHTLQEVIEYARDNMIQICPVKMGFDADDERLDKLARGSSGFYCKDPSPMWIWEIYSTISSIITSGPYPDCIIQYPSCLNGRTRTVILSLERFCAGIDTAITATAKYKVPLDTSTLIPLMVRIADLRASSDTIVRVPIILDTRVQNDSLRSSSIVLKYDTAALRFDHIDAPPGSLWHGAISSSVAAGDSVTIEVSSRYFASAEGPMAELIFQTRSVPDTTVTRIGIGSWVFSAGCFRPVVSGGAITIAPNGPLSVDDRIRQAPDGLRLYQNQPNPFNGATSISYDIPRMAHVRLVVTDMFGREVRSLIDGTQSEGFHTVDFVPGELSQSSYFYKLETGGRRLIRRMVVIK
jgi:hypothetical protein